jgi:hypothetical protein
MPTTAEECRQRAARAKRLADAMWDQRTCDGLRELAAEYELEARELEETVRKTPSGPLTDLQTDPANAPDGGGFANCLRIALS